MVHQNSLKQEELKDFCQEHTKPQDKRKPQNQAPFLKDLGAESKGKEPKRVHAYIPQQILKKTASKSL
jgi:hypothetical protein